MEVMNILSYDFGAFLLWNYMFFLLGLTFGTDVLREKYFDDTWDYRITIKYQQQRQRQ